jgi:hypothetical protein
MAINLCSVAIALGKKDCNSTWLVKTGEKSVAELTEADLEVLFRRTGLHKNQLTTICYHHDSFYIRTNKYAFGRQVLWCCNPFGSHLNKRRGMSFLK